MHISHHALSMLLYTYVLGKLTKASFDSKAMQRECVTMLQAQYAVDAAAAIRHRKAARNVQL